MIEEGGDGGVLVWVGSSPVPILRGVQFLNRLVARATTPMRVMSSVTAPFIDTYVSGPIRSRETRRAAGANRLWATPADVTGVTGEWPRPAAGRQSWPCAARSGLKLAAVRRQ